MKQFLILSLLVALAACGNPAAQQAGLVCAADAGSKVLVVASTVDPAGVKAVNAAVTTGAVLATDGACQTAIAGLNTKAASSAPAPLTSAPAPTK